MMVSLCARWKPSYIDGMAIINMHQAKSALSDLVARAEAGEEIVIARRNKPAVRLVPVAETSSRVRQARAGAIGSLAHLRDAMQDIDWFEPLPEEELLAWEGRSAKSSDPTDQFNS
jgi:prevent-host-death family protein